MLEMHLKGENNVLLIKKKTIQNHPDYLKWVNWLFGIEDQIWGDNHNQSLNYFNHGYVESKSRSCGAQQKYHKNTIFTLMDFFFLPLKY